MKLTPEQYSGLQAKKIANIVKKVSAGKTLTAREEAILAASQAGGATDLPSAFADTWEDLAKALKVTRRAIQDWRNRPDLVGKLPTSRADGRHDIAAWSTAMITHGLARADEDVSAEDITDDSRRTIRDWKAYREELMCQKLETEIARDDGRLLVAADLEQALGQLLAGISTALHHLPSSAARFLVGLRDVHAVQTKLESEVHAVMLSLHTADYLDLVLPGIVEALEVEQAQKPHILTACTTALRQAGCRLLAIAQGKPIAPPPVVEMTPPPAPDAPSKPKARKSKGKKTPPRQVSRRAPVGKKPRKKHPAAKAKAAHLAVDRRR